MAIQQAKVPSKNFRDLIRAVLKFPPSASVAASEVVHFSVNKGRARASVAGVVVSTATVLGMRYGPTLSYFQRMQPSMSNSPRRRIRCGWYVGS